MWKDTFQQILEFELSLSTGLVGVATALGLFAISQLALVAMLVALPTDFLCGHRSCGFDAGRRSLLGLAAKISKNLGGLLLVLLGIPLTLPGIPGPGLVMILIGVSLIDFPGKQQLVQRIVGRPGVLRTINSLRARFGRLPLIFDSSLRSHTTNSV